MSSAKEKRECIQPKMLFNDFQKVNLYCVLGLPFVLHITISHILLFFFKRPNFCRKTESVKVRSFTCMSVFSIL